MSIGVEDYCLELGVEPSADGIELLYPVARLVSVCKAVGVQPTGLVGSIAGFRTSPPSRAPRSARASWAARAPAAFIPTRSPC